MGAGSQTRLSDGLLMKVSPTSFSSHLYLVILILKEDWRMAGTRERRAVVVGGDSQLAFGVRFSPIFFPLTLQSTRQVP